MTAAQLQLPLDCAPPVVREHGLSDAHHNPLAAWAKGGPSWRTSPARAWQLPLLELDRTATSYAAIGVDVDGRDRVIGFLDRVEAGMLPEPNLITERLRTGNVQSRWFLSRPVHRGPSARDRPLQALARVAEWLSVEAGADAGYAGVLGRNPLDAVHDDPRALDGPCRTVWRRREAYSLHELSNCVPLGWRKPSVAVSPIGRNVSIFRALMRESGKPSNWGRPVGGLAAALNDAVGRLFAVGPLDAGELAGIVASVERIQSRNLAAGRTQAGFRALQADRGRRSGQSRRKGTELEHDREPWRAAGVSRATWYRRRAGRETEPKQIDGVPAGGADRGGLRVANRL